MWTLVTPLVFSFLLGCRRRAAHAVAVLAIAALARGTVSVAAARWRYAGF